MVWECPVAPHFPLLGALGLFLSLYVAWSRQGLLPAPHGWASRTVVCSGDLNFLGDPCFEAAGSRACRAPGTGAASLPRTPVLRTVSAPLGPPLLERGRQSHIAKGEGEITATIWETPICHTENGEK